MTLLKDLTHPSISEHIVLKFMKFSIFFKNNGVKFGYRAEKWSFLGVKEEEDACHVLIQDVATFIRLKISVCMELDTHLSTKQQRQLQKIQISLFWRFM